MRAIKYIFLTLPFVLFCCQRPSQATSITQEEVIPTDTIAQIPLDSVERLINEPSREEITFTMDSLWKYHDLNLATYGCCNRPPFYSYGLTRNLHYGFYCIIDRKPLPPGHSGSPYANIADMTVSYVPPKKWTSRDTSLRICEIIVRDNIFRPKVAPFKIGDKTSQIKEELLKEIGSVHYYRNGDVLYCVESIQDTIRQYMVLYSCTEYDWLTLNEYICQQFKNYEASLQ